MPWRPRAAVDQRSRWWRGDAAAVLLLTFNMEARAADVPHISGGVGADERQGLLAKERDYNLKIIGADKSGNYLADVQVVIESARKERVLDTTMDGPILLAKLAPGTYTIRATLMVRRSPGQ